MNAWLVANQWLWQLAGWTMIHFLWIGAIAALLGAAVRLACRRAAPNVRYAASLATLALLAGLPIAIALLLNSTLLPDSPWQPLAATTSPLPPPGGEGWGGGRTANTLPHPSLTLPIKGRGPEVADAGGRRQSTPRIIDLAHIGSSPQYSGERSGEGSTSRVEQPPAIVTSATPSPPPVHRSPVTDPRSPITDHPHLTSHAAQAATRLATLLPAIWLVGAPFTFTLLAAGLIGSRRLRHHCTPLTAGPTFDACQRLRTAMRMTRRVSLAACDGVAQPILVGIIRPLILLPTAALAGWTPEQLDMVLLHELAHVRRWDNLVNLLQRLVESLLFFHPAVWLASRQVRRDREECCDAAVVAHTKRPHEYAELLLAIAAARRGGPAPSLAMASAMADHPLTGRIRRILNLEDEPMWISRRTLAATLLLPLLLAGAIFYSGANADPPPSKGGARGWIPYADPQSTTVGGKQLQSDPPAKKAADDSNATFNAVSVPVTYPIAAAPAVLLSKLAEVTDGHEIAFRRVAGNPPQWALTVSAPMQVHEQLEALLAEATMGEAPTTQISNGTTSLPQLQNDNLKQDDLRSVLLDTKDRLHRQLETLKKRRTEMGALRSEIEVPQLKNEIKTLEGLIVKAKEELVNLEVFKQLTIQNARSPAAQDAMVTVELDKDPTIAMYQQQLFVLQQQLQQRTATTQDKDSPEIKRLQATLQQTEEQMAQYRGNAEKSVREKLAKTPNDALRSALAEHKIRYETTTKNLAEYEQQLAAANAKLLELSIAERERQLLEENIENETAIAQRLEQAVMQWKVREEMQSSPFQGSPGSPNQGGAATGSDPDQTPSAPQASRGSAAPVQEPEPPAKAFILFFPPNFPDSEQERERIRKGFEADGLPAVVEMKEVDGQTLPSLRVSVPAHWYPMPVWETRMLGNAMMMVCRIINEPVGGPGSSNQGGAAAGGDPSNDNVEIPATAPGVVHPVLPPSTRNDNPRVAAQYLLNRERLDRLTPIVAANKLHPEIAEISFDKNLGVLTVVATEQAQSGLSKILKSHGLLVDAPLSANGTFPTLEDQKIADRAYKLLRVELEPATGEDLELAKRQGYAGGLRIAGAENGSKFTGFTGDVLVGLHVWPITDLKSLDAVLSRDDLADLSPLKYYIVLKGRPGPYGAEGEGDEVVTGRIHLDADALRTSNTERAGSPGSPNQGGAAARGAASSVAVGELTPPLEPQPTYNEINGTVPKIGGAGVIQEFPADADPKATSTALDQYRSEGRQVNLEHNVDGRARIVDLSPTPSLSSQDNLSQVDAPGSPGSPNQGGATAGGNVTEDTSPTEASSGLVATTQESMQPTVEDSTVDDNQRDSVGAVTEVKGLKFTKSYPPNTDANELSKVAEQLRQVGNQVQITKHADGSTRITAAAEIKPTPSSASASSFPTLENQKIADLAYKLLGWELEPLTAEELAIVKSHGYEGGLRLEGSKRWNPGVVANEMPVYGDFLVGLHTWPVRNFEDLKQVLQRKDLNELSPLKFYVVSRFLDRGNQDAWKAHGGKWSLMKGRIQIDADALRELATAEAGSPGSPNQGGAAAGGAPSPANAAETPSIDDASRGFAAPVQEPEPPPTYLYDGKSFHAWRDLWKNELKTERRIEAIEALAAFARAGYGREAAEEILAVAGQYDDDGSNEKLLQAIQQALARMPADHWMPQVLAKIKSSDGSQQERWRQHASRFLRATRDSSEDARRLAAQFALDPEDGLVSDVARYLLRSDQLLKDPVTVRLVRASLQQENPATDLLVGLGFQHLHQIPEQLTVLFHPGVRLEARRQLREVAQQNPQRPGVAIELTGPLLKILDDPDRKDDYVAALRALKAMAAAFRSSGTKTDKEQVAQRLEQFLRDCNDKEVIPAYAALARFASYSTNDIPNELLRQGKISPERAKLLKNIDSQALSEEINAD